MNEKQLEYARQWVEKARHDTRIRSANQLARTLRRHVKMHGGFSKFLRVLLVLRAEAPETVGLSD
jgi:hypothetical protein